MKEPDHVDYKASTPVDPGVLDAVWPWPGEGVGNASSAHDYGRMARAAAEAAR